MTAHNNRVCIWGSPYVIFGDSQPYVYVYGDPVMQMGIPICKYLHIMGIW